MPSPIHYTVCTITGLSQTCKDDYKYNKLWATQHQVVGHSAELYRLIETKSNTLPLSYLAAGILLQLQEAGLIAYQNKEQEIPYLRGRINEQLQQIPHGQLVALYWNCKGGAGRTLSAPLTLNLNSIANQAPSSIYASIKAIACQDVGTADMDVFIQSQTQRRKQGIKGTISRSKMDLHSAGDRVAKLLPRLHNGLAESKIKVKSIKVVTGLLKWDKNIDAPKWQDVDGRVKARMIEVLDQLVLEAKEGYMLDRDSLADKSFKVVLKAIATGRKQVSWSEGEWV